MSTGTEMERAIEGFGPGVEGVNYVNEAGVPEDVMKELRSNQDVANAIEKWSQSLALDAEPTVPTLRSFASGKAATHKGIFGQMSQCAWAVEADDILSTLADVVEALTFQKVHFELFEQDEQDVWNQWAAMVDLDSVLRQANRELFKVSQVYIGMWWSKEILTVREDRIESVVQQMAEDERKRKQAEGGLPEGEEDKKKSAGPGRGNYKRQKKYALELPSALTIFDPTKIVPVGNLMFGRERFAYVASSDESEGFDQTMKGKVADATVMQLIERKYTPSKGERQEFEALGVDCERLWLMRSDAVFRHTLTRAHYERFAPVRLRSALPVLEMKGHLRSSDRSSLVGNTNFIVLVTKGSDKLPAKQNEIEHLQEQAKVIARLPVLVGDHRLNVSIISPALDNTLQQSRWEVLDSRLVFKALNTFQPTVQGGNSSGSIKEMSRIVARGLEGRRHMLVRAFERHIFKTVMEKNEGTITESPSMTFTPKRIALDYSAEVITQILKLRDRGDISRETTLEELDYDQDIEVLRRQRERIGYDPVFQSQTPHSSPTSNPYSSNENNLGPNGQPRTEGGRPVGVVEEEPRTTK